MKKLLAGIGMFFGLAIFAQLIGVSFAAPFPTGVGGTGTSATPASGTILIGNGAGSYTPGFLNCSGTCSVSNGSGTITITVTGGSSSGTVFLLTGGHGISLSPASITASGTISVNTSTIVADVLASGNFLPSSTTYVVTVNGQSGAVTLGIPATTTINGAQAAVFKLTGDGTTVTSTASGTTTTFSIINTGNWAGTWQGVNSSTFYLSSNPSGYISGNQTITLTPSGDVSGTASGATSLTPIYKVIGLNGSSLPANATGSLVYLNGSFQFLNPFLFSAGTGIGLQTTGATQTITNTGVTSFNANTGTVAYAITCVSGCSIASTTTSTAITITGGTGSTTQVFGINGITAVQVGPNVTTSINEAYGNAWTVAQTFAGILNSGNVTTTNETVSTTLTLSHANASGSWNSLFSNDGNYTELNVSGSIPGTNRVPYNILLQNCPPVGTTSTAVTSSSWKCALSQAENFPDGSRSFVDWDTEYYPTGTTPNVASGWFDNRRGTSSVEFPFVLSWNDGTVNHVGFQMTPATNTSASNFNTLDNNGTGYFTVGTASSTTGAFDVFQNGGNSCAGIYDSGASTIYGLTDSLPAPAGCTALGGYYKGLGIGGSTSSGGNPIFGVLNSAQSSNGRGHTAFTVYDSNEVDTYNNELDDGSGNASISSTLTVYKNLNVSGTLNASTSITIAGNAVATSTNPGAGSCTNCNVTFNASGLATTFANGSGGSGSGVPSTTPYTAGFIPVVSSTGALANSMISQSISSSTVTIASTQASSSVVFNNSTGTPSYFLQIENASGTNEFSVASSGLTSVNSLSVSSTFNSTLASSLPSSSVAFVFEQATTTVPYDFQWLITPTAKNITYVDCGEYAAATTTIELGYATTTKAAAAGTIGQVIISSIACGINAASTTSFTTSTLPIGSYLIAAVSSIAGTPALTDLNVVATKL